jgi:two-component system, NtrC family, response regulator AtoC
MQIEPTGQRILVIDDETNMRHMLAAVLTKAGYEVVSAPDGEAGLRKVEQTPYDFILCDIKMPVMSGMEFLNAAGERIGQGTVS